MNRKIATAFVSSFLIGTGAIAFAIADASQYSREAETTSQWVMALGAIVGIVALIPERKDG